LYKEFLKELDVMYNEVHDRTVKLCPGKTGLRQN
jgi:hypothetical protein